ncbi:MAG TPA: DinB family protein [Bryobacteraceae bacterium]|jgi:uncharacterized damage-inducible protein DinB
MPQVEAFLNEFDEEMKSTRKLLERVPDGKFDYKPHEKSMHLGRLASHVAELPGWVKETMSLELLVIQPGQKPFWAKSRQELLEAFDKNVAAGREKLAAASDADLQKTWTLKFGDRTVFSMPRSQVLRGMVLSHLIHHRAQLGVYLRLNEIEIPGMYGPSADEMKFWQAEPEKATA